MPEWPKVLRNGKRLVLPSLFVKPSTVGEAEILYNSITDHPDHTRELAGYVTSMKDWRPIAAVLSDLRNREPNTFIC